MKANTGQPPHWGEMLMCAQPARTNRPPIILTDATCDLPPAIVQEYAIQVIPLEIVFGEETYRSGENITAEQFYERLERGDVHPTTTPPTHEEMVEKYRALGTSGAPVLSIHVSVGLSQTAQVARRAALQLRDEMSITVSDSKMVSGSLGLQVLTAARAARAGYTVEQIVPLLHQTYEAGNIFFCLSDLTHLYRGGRIGRVSYHVAQTLRLKPIITVSKEGQTVGTYISGAERPHSMQAAVNALVRHVAQQVEPHGKVRALVLYSGRSMIELAAQLNDILRERFDCVFLDTRPVAPVLAVYTGPTGLGIAFAGGEWAV
jgi:DegV family protein with EDD domain